MVPALLTALALSPWHAATTGQAADPAACRVWLADCRALLVENKGSAARSCLEQFLADCPDRREVELAESLLELAVRMEQGDRKEGTESGTGSAVGPQPGERRADARTPLVEQLPAFSVSAFVLSGAPELMLGSTLYGATAGFVATGALVSALRTSEADSLPALITFPVVGAVAGLALSTAAWQWLHPEAGDAAQISSAMLWGTVYGTLAQGVYEMAHADQGLEAHRTPWRFALVLGTSAVATTTAALTAPFLHVDPGDVGLANSAALWGGILPLFFMAMLEQPRTPVGMVMVPLASSLLSYDLVLALSPLIRLPRPATWLVEVGGVLGLLVSLGLTPILAVSDVPAPLLIGVMGVGTGTGVAAGVVASFLVAGAVEGTLPDWGPFERTAVLPALLDSGRPDGTLLPGLSLVGVF
ncbi:MAG: hypothetical protein ABIJ09_22280 [Pseudomonadota bacterium]